MKLRSILSSMLLATAPFAGAQDVDYVIVRAATQAEAGAMIQPAVATRETPAVKPAAEVDSGRASTESVTRELDAMLEQRFEHEHAAPERPAARALLVSAS
ncbi:hypothetical protein [Parahaliea mediterranea]|uniref:DUF4148 domain-containing protein n=1 Tax=Parahaliea mediterranea TaxID=651086 RepID=A0A939DFD9_9GAMM|nr:hypothetical protein [Parahaliea mediterranea]MBN7797098.1 hypothetical protein [Parahaliea mediterranea]